MSANEINFLMHATEDTFLENMPSYIVAPINHAAPLSACQFLRCTTMLFLRQACIYVYKCVYEVDNVTHTYNYMYVHMYISPHNCWACLLQYQDIAVP